MLVLAHRRTDAVDTHVALEALVPDPDQRVRVVLAHHDRHRRLVVAALAQVKVASATLVVVVVGGAVRLVVHACEHRTAPAANVAIILGLAVAELPQRVRVRRHGDVRSGLQRHLGRPAGGGVDGGGLVTERQRQHHLRAVLELAVLLDLGLAVELLVVHQHLLDVDALASRDHPQRVVVHRQQHRQAVVRGVRLDLGWLHRLCRRRSASRRPCSHRVVDGSTRPRRWRLATDFARPCDEGCQGRLGVLVATVWRWCAGGPLL